MLEIVFWIAAFFLFCLFVILPLMAGCGMFP